jgi:hypothetical protein
MQLLDTAGYGGYRETCQLSAVRYQRELSIPLVFGFG